MSTLRVACLTVTLMLSSLALAKDGATPEQVVRAYAAAWNAGELEGFIALHSPDVHKYQRADPTSEFRLTTEGRDVVKEKYQPLFAKPSRVKVEIVSVTSLGEIVVTRDRVSGGDGHVSNELTMYDVRDGLIHNIWYLGRVVE